MGELGNLYVIAAPSGTGKTTLVKALTESVNQITVSISYTTRPKRPAEIEGKNYHFISLAEFNKMIAHEDFLEHAQIFENYYGTSKSWVEKTLHAGTDVILEIDWQGFQQIKRLFRNSIGIFILPPTFKDLKERLEIRDQDHPEVILTRLADAKVAISHAKEFDYIIVNDNFEQALYELTVIVEAGRLQRPRQLKRYAKLINAFNS